jgi:hypothetical protein
MFKPPGVGQTLITKPVDQLLAVGDGRLPEAEQLADFVAVVFDCAPLPVIALPGGWRHSELACQVIDHGLGHFAGRLREAALMLEILQ